MKFLLELAERILNDGYPFGHTLKHLIHCEHLFFSLRFGHPLDIKVDLIALQQICRVVLPPTAVRIRVRIKRLFSV